ncbi:UDP-N-acetylglucosamine--undecaprenyl-phosphate N-acetylglucosaminephosphotransferase [Shewanella zhangzhouensis]|uniref:UDP-N-acetylglucosamine--undecaprenyl-phosphate N-acetylglucosaminephosphotransferase n=1 Tax=Shewanella zhangzhouensis TaxID=2864213 RepID=UPI001C6613ED|nr:UDP-N-acetylglucosamine--undecaprenyl-phosphate N-acetylglucosaminephosphotransferase [Shewanella zhangzhouensis]QYK07183.1 UDP-N-acetylglucosamine--undecaprenyl-phosphate N-acetylglucosaminephosphotransferase [Shewanella zhangzhouensis]
MDYVIPLLATFGISFVAIKLIKPLAVKAGLVDLPNERKLHVGAIPLIGGISIFIGVLMASMFFIQQSQIFNIYLISSALILFLGVLDDRYDLSVKLRMTSQVLVASLMIFGAGFYLKTLGHIVGPIEVLLGPLGALVTIVAVIGAINAFNMVDGIDGLAGMLSLVTFSGLAFLLSRVNNDWYLLPILFIAALLAYLMFNLSWPKNFGKIFMGDAGSMLIGLTVVWLLVIGSSQDVQAFRPVTALYLIAIPLMDMAAIMYRRIRKGVSPFKADRDHLHHIFERAGFNRKQTLLIITVISAFITIIGCLAEVYMVSESLMFFGFMIMFTIYSWILMHVWQVVSWIRLRLS